MSINHPYKKYQNSKLWEIIERSLSDLVQNQDIIFNTRREYIIGYLAKEISQQYQELGLNKSLAWIQQWYWDKCNGDWEHAFGVSIESMDNTGWSIKVDLRETELVDVTFDPISVRQSIQDWYTCEVVENQFVAYGGPGNLIEIMDAFRRWSSRHQCLPSLFNAIKVGNVKAIRNIVTGDLKNLDIINDYGWTPLALAVETGDESTVECLIDLGAEVDGHQWLGNSVSLHGPSQPNIGTLLHLAISKGVSMVELLLRHGADPNAPDDMGNTPLHWAAGYQPDEEVIRALISYYRIDRGAKNDDGETPTQLAHSQGYHEIARQIEGV